jgi:serine/threonine-protein kinase
MAIDLIEQVADGLADAHAAGLVHRDIKPANVLLRRRADGYTAYLADFGIARQVDGEATRTSHSTVGTPSYMAPELHTGGQPGVASDVYSLGCLLWATLTGRAPYVGTSDFEIATAHREKPVPQLPDDGPLAGRLNELLRHTLAKDPAQRPASAAAVRDWLRSLRGPVTPTMSPPPPQRRGRLLAVALVLVAAVVVASVGVAYAVTRGDDEPKTSSDSDEPSSSTSVSVNSSPVTTPPASPSVSAAPAGTDKERAVASMAAAFADQLGIPLDNARCVARETIEAVGLQTLVDIGMFDDAMTFHDVELGPYPDVKDALSAASLTCATA